MTHVLLNKDKEIGELFYKIGAQCNNQPRDVILAALAMHVAYIAKAMDVEIGTTKKEMVIKDFGTLLEHAQKFWDEEFEKRKINNANEARYLINSDYRKKLKAKGLVRLELWVKPEYKKTIKKMSKDINEGKEVYLDQDFINEEMEKFRKGFAYRPKVNKT